MDTTKKMLSPNRIKRLKIQGYCNMTDTRLSELAFGNRFAYILCSGVVGVGVLTAHIPILGTMMVVALFGVLLPNHPFDYIYNYGIRDLMGKPKLPRRSKQIKFACIVATIWLAITIGLFHIGFATGGYIVGGVLFSLTFIVSTTDICVPSLIYNYWHKIKV